MFCTNFDEKNLSYKMFENLSNQVAEKRRQQTKLLALIFVGLAGVVGFNLWLDQLGTTRSKQWNFSDHCKLTKKTNININWKLNERFIVKRQGGIHICCPPVQNRARGK